MMKLLLWNIMEYYGILSNIIFKKSIFFLYTIKKSIDKSCNILLILMVFASINILFLQFMCVRVRDCPPAICG